MSMAEHTDFPVWGLLPRKETGIVNLLSKNPQYDGRGTVIAIFDSGVDPLAPGLQVTTDGKIKVIDRIDASGAGDVDTSTVAELVDGKLTGLTGRQLTVCDSWTNPSGKYYLGTKTAFSLYPSGLKERIMKERKETHWDPVHKGLLAEAQKQFQNAKNAYDNKSISVATSPTEVKPSALNDGNGSPDTKPTLPESNGSTTVSFMEKMQKDNAEARVTLLNSMEKKFCDLGPVYDCVVFHDGEVWRACIDTSECGDLENGVFLGEFIKTHEAAILTSVDQYTVTINVYNEGTRLEIVGMCSSHGTHVASIASANFPETPEKNGVAPGAQIVSITIGDNRLGSMETGTSLVRAMARVMKNPYYKVDVINMSYGEHAHWSNSGRLGDLVYEVVNKYGVIWAGSAGNHGPALVTIGVPPDFNSDSIMGIGAYVSPEMMTAEYSMIEKLPGCPFTWSSRGPTADGGRGVSVCAPGGAITSVPTFTLRNNQLMNGTSMASPHTAGCLALLVSGLKQKEIAYSPYSLRRAVETSAQRLDVDVFAQGHGLIQVDRALDHLTQYSGNIVDKVRFSVECGKYHEKGIHFRNWPADKPRDIAVTIEPILLDDQRADPQDKLAFNLELALVCDSTWVKAPPCFQTSYVLRSFKVSVDPRGLPRGQVYFSAIKAYSSTQPDKGALFEIPVTMVVPEINLINNFYFHSPPEQYRSGRIRRYFLTAPMEATWASVSIKATASDKLQRFTLHTVQLKPFSSISTLEYNKVFTIGAEEISTHVFKVQGGLTLEVCLARWWSCLLDGQVELSVDFHSILPSQDEVTLVCSDGVARVDVSLGLRAEEVLPQVMLKYHCQVLSPSDSKVEVLGGERDTIPTNRQIYQLVLSYNLSIAKSGVEVTPKCPLLNDILYECPYESQLWMLFDCNKQVLGTGDAYSGKGKYGIKLDKGEYVIRMHIRHERCDLLEKLTETPFNVQIKLLQEIKLDVYGSYNAAITSGRKAQSHLLSKGVIQPYYFTAPNLTDKSLKGLNLAAGHSFLGIMTLSKDEQIKKAVQYPFQVFISEFSTKKRAAAAAASSATSSEEKKDPKSMADFQEALRDVQTTWIAKLDNESSEKLYEEVISNHPDHLPAQLARLQALDGAPHSRETVIALAKQIVSSIDVNPFLAFYGTKTDTRHDATKIRIQMDRQRNFFLEAISRLGVALCAELMALPVADRSAENMAEVDNIASEILKFVDTSESKVINFFISYYQMREFDGLAARLLAKQMEEKWTKETEIKLIDVFTRLGWTHAAIAVERAHAIRFPATYTPF